MTDNTRGAFEFEEDPIHSDFDSRDTTYTPVQARTRGGSVTLEEVEEDEWDELDEPGAFPLMTSDLAYPEGDVDVDGMCIFVQSRSTSMAYILLCNRYGQRVGTGRNN